MASSELQQQSQARLAVIRRLVHDQPALAAQMGAAGRERALGRFSMEVMLDKMESVFRRALA